MANQRNATAIATSTVDGPRRSTLAQARSQDTRRRLIRAALALWAERGFERGLEDTSADEIATAAGVSKGTFYFHFAHKEDILLEMTWATAESMLAEAERAMAADVALPALLDQLVSSLARRVSRVPRAAVTRTVGRWPVHALAQRTGERKGLAEVFADVLSHGAARGDIPHHVDVDDLSRLLETAVLEALMHWAVGEEPPTTLTEVLRRRAELLLRGACVTYPVLAATTPQRTSHRPRSRRPTT